MVFWCRKLQIWNYNFGTFQQCHITSIFKIQNFPWVIHVFDKIKLILDTTGLNKTTKLILPTNDTRFFLFHFRDNGITIQISIYQIYTELFMFLILLIFIPITIFGPKTENWTRIFGIFTSIMCFVIRPIFLLFGDVNFRRRVLDQGIWKALKKELFSNNAEIQPVNWFFEIKADNQLYSCLSFKFICYHCLRILWYYLDNALIWIMYFNVSSFVLSFAI